AGGVGEDQAQPVGADRGGDRAGGLLLDLVDDVAEVGRVGNGGVERPAAGGGDAEVVERPVPADAVAAVERGQDAGPADGVDGGADHGVGRRGVAGEAEAGRGVRRADVGDDEIARAAGEV